MAKTNEKQGQSDDPRQAIEAGDPKAEGRIRGAPMDENDPDAAQQSSQDKPGDAAEHRESGRGRSDK
jgi:hypothetical protein